MGEYKIVPFIFRFGEIELFELHLKANVLNTNYYERASHSNLECQIEELLQDGAEVVIIRSCPTSYDLPRISITSDIIKFVREQYRRYHVNISGSFEEYIQAFSSRARATLRRKVRKFKEFSNGKIHWHEYKKTDEIDEFYKYSRQVSQKSYQERLLQSGLPESRAFQEKLKSLAATQSMRGYILFSSNKPISYMYCPIINQKILVYQYVGYDPDYQKWSPGTVLQYLVLEKLFAENNDFIFDFTEGDGQHKKLFSTHNQQCADIYLFKRSLRNLMIISLYCSIEGISNLLVNILDTIKLKSIVKRYIRFKNFKTN